MQLGSHHTISKVGHRGKRLENGLQELIKRSELHRQAQLFGGLVNSWIREKGDVTIVPILHGAGWISQRIQREIAPTSTHEERAIVAQSYGDATAARPVTIHMQWIDPKRHIEGKHILLIDDIFDSGATMTEAVRAIGRFEPASIEIFFMLRKVRGMQEPLAPRWVMFDIDDVWVVGAGLDDAGKYRHLPYIAERPL